MAISAKGYEIVRTGGRNEYAHRLVIGAKPGEIVDHINGDKLDNRPENLRIVTNKDNVRKRMRLNKNNTSGYRGVYWNKQYKRWEARIKVNRKEIYLGRFRDLLEAAATRRAASIKYYGEFAGAV